MKQTKVAICAPCHIPPIPEWIEALERERKATDATVIIVDDSNGKLGVLPSDWKVFDYLAQEIFLRDLYPEFAKIFHKSSACRIFGHIWAYNHDFDVVIGLDSDCVVKDDFVGAHIHTLGKELGGGWQNPIQGSGFYPRGFPYHLRNWKVVANMGLWDKTLDLNGADRMKDEPTECEPTEGIAVAPIPFSGMNFSIAREAIPAFLFFPNFDYNENKFRRIDDIWGGYVFQKMAKLMKHSITYGYPMVDHITEVIAEEDAEEEEGMYQYEETFIDAVDHVFDILKAFMPSDINYLYLYQKFAEYFIKQDAFLEFQSVNPALAWWVKVWMNYGRK